MPPDRGVNLRAFLANEVAAEGEIKRRAAVRGQPARDCFWRSFEKNHTFEGLVLCCPRISSSDQWNQGGEGRRKKNLKGGEHGLENCDVGTDTRPTASFLYFWKAFTWFLQKTEASPSFCSYIKPHITQLKTHSLPPSLPLSVCLLICWVCSDSKKHQAGGRKKKTQHQLWSVSWIQQNLSSENVNPLVHFGAVLAPKQGSGIQTRPPSPPPSHYSNLLALPPLFLGGTCDLPVTLQPNQTLLCGWVDIFRRISR